LEDVGNAKPILIVYPEQDQLFARGSSAPQKPPEIARCACIESEEMGNVSECQIANALTEALIGTAASAFRH
jgi:hypothetical protein